MRILIAEDEPVARMILRELLDEIPGITIAGEATNGAEALAQAAALKPDVILLDLQMPGMGGLEAAAHFPPASAPAGRAGASFR